MVVRTEAAHTGGVPLSSDVEFLVAPLLSLAVVALLALVLRWAFGSTGSVTFCDRIVTQTPSDVRGSGLWRAQDGRRRLRCR